MTYRDNAACEACSRREHAETKERRQWLQSVTLRLATWIPIVLGLGAAWHYACVKMEEVDARVDAAERMCHESARVIDTGHSVSCGKMVGAKLVVDGNVARCVCPEEKP